MPHKDKNTSNRERKTTKNHNGNDNRTGKYSQKHIRIHMEIINKDNDSNKNTSNKNTSRYNKK